MSLFCAKNYERKRSQKILQFKSVETEKIRYSATGFVRMSGLQAAIIKGSSKGNPINRRRCKDPDSLRSASYQRTERLSELGFGRREPNQLMHTVS